MEFLSLRLTKIKLVCIPKHNYLTFCKLTIFVVMFVGQITDSTVGKTLFGET